MSPEQAQKMAQETHLAIEKLNEQRVPNIEPLDIYSEDGLVIGPDEILNAFTSFNTTLLPERVEELRKSIVSAISELNSITAEAMEKMARDREAIDLAVAELKAKLMDDVRCIPETLLTRKLRVGKKIIDPIDFPFLLEAYKNLGFKYCSIEPTSDYIYFDPQAGEIRQLFLKEFHRLTNKKYPSLSNYVQCDNSHIHDIDTLMYVVGLNKNHS